MDTAETLLLMAHVLAALAIVGLVLIQQGKGADMGSGFGAGASATVFGSGGAGSFLTRLTTVIAIAFFLSSFGLAFFAKERSEVARDLGVPQVEDYAPPPALDGQEGYNGGALEGQELPAFDSGSPSMDNAVDADGAGGMDSAAGELPAFDAAPESGAEGGGSGQ